MTAKRFHQIATGFWVLAIIPTVLWWKESILWVGLMSVWANVASHWSAYQGTKAEESAKEKEDDA